MSNYTAELRTIIDNEFDIFDFEYTRTDASIAIVSDEVLEQGFIDRYYFSEIGFETLERFKHKLKTQWLESIGNFDKLLIAYNESVNVKSNVKTTQNNKITFNETPESALSSADYATTITDNDNDLGGYSNTTEIELLELYHDKIKDIQSEFYDGFSNLFMGIF